MTADDTDLLARRLAAVRAWTAFVEHGDGAQTLVRPEIYSSWERSGAAITTDVRHAPLADEADTRAFWRGSPLPPNSVSCTFRAIYPTKNIGWPSLPI